MRQFEQLLHTTRSLVAITRSTCTTRCLNIHSKIFTHTGPSWIRWPTTIHLQPTNHSLSSSRGAVWTQAILSTRESLAQSLCTFAYDRHDKIEFVPNTCHFTGGKCQPPIMSANCTSRALGSEDIQWLVANRPSIISCVHKASSTAHTTSYTHLVS